MFSSATQPPPRHNFVVSAITFEGFRLCSSNFALLIQIYRTSSIIDIVVPFINKAPPWCTIPIVVSVGFRQFPGSTHGWSAQNVFEEEICRRRRLFSLKLTFQGSSGLPPVRRSYLIQSRRFGCCISGRSHLYHHGVLRALRCNR